MLSEIANNALLPPQLANNRGLVNTFTGQKALLEQATDMLRFCQVGTQVFEQYITHTSLISRVLPVLQLHGANFSQWHQSRGVKGGYHRKRRRYSKSLNASMVQSNQATF